MATGQLPTLDYAGRNVRVYGVYGRAGMVNIKTARIFNGVFET